MGEAVFITRTGLSLHHNQYTNSYDYDSRYRVDKLQKSTSTHEETLRVVSLALVSSDGNRSI